MAECAVQPERITPLYWDLRATKREEAELVFRAGEEGVRQRDRRHESRRGTLVESREGGGVGCGRHVDHASGRTGRSDIESSC
ncbi:hypothetical protein SAMN05444920_13337 [Nonomuraea solani]|uniref:Uncharacterized protein n=1 Tax=Nonomuraea solani TaxID=1144553 RepID=A0A1H6F0L1_9ACTN|nr:hypothetical protein [Nonomuraea solani]SEH03133.1 hypothetical protein SAMN05444920_13337 [Nonomuraea solani]